MPEIKLQLQPIYIIHVFIRFVNFVTHYSLFSTIHEQKQTQQKKELSRKAVLLLIPIRSSRDSA